MFKASFLVKSTHGRLFGWAFDWVIFLCLGKIGSGNETAKMQNICKIRFSFKVKSFIELQILLKF